MKFLKYNNSSTSINNETLLVDVYFKNVKDKYPEWRITIDISILMVYALFCIFAWKIMRKGQKKVDFIKNNKNMIEDEEWKDIHMEAPQIILKTTILSMRVYIFNKLLQIVIESLKICYGSSIEYDLWNVNFYADYVCYLIILCLNAFIFAI